MNFVLNKKQKGSGFMIYYHVFEVIVDGLLDGWDEDRILKKVAEEFPNSNTIVNSIKTYQKYLNYRLIAPPSAPASRLTFDGYTNGKTEYEIHRKVNELSGRTISLGYVRTFVHHMKQVDSRIDLRKK